MATLWLCLVFFLSLVLAHPTDLFPGNVPGSFSVGVNRNPRFKPNGPAQHLRALAKWNVEIPTGLAAFVFSSKGAVGDVIAYNMSDDREYLSPIGLGTPPQEVQLDLDSGSSDLWVFSSETKTSGAAAGGRKIWHPELSSTATKMNGSRWAIVYGDGSYATGGVWKDDLHIGRDIVLHNAIIESAVSASRSMVRDPVLSGILGLAYNLSSQVTPPQPAVLDVLAPMLDQQVYTVDLHYHDSGLYQFGTIDHSKHVGEITWVPLVDEATFWEINFTGFNVGSTSVWLLSEWDAIVDTGTTLLLLPHDLSEVYYKEIPSSSFNESLQAWTFPCNVEVPDVHISFGPSGGGWHASIPGKYINYAPVGEDDPGSDQCYGGIQDNGGIPFAILGDVFLKALFAIFDKEGARVGFADKNLSNK